MPKQTETATDVQGTEVAKNSTDLSSNKSEKKEVKKNPNFFLKDDVEKEALLEIFNAGKEPFLENLSDGYAKKLGQRMIDGIEEKLNKSLGV